MTNVPGDAPADGCHFAELLGKVGFAARCRCQPLEHTWVPVRIFFVEYANGVNDSAGLSGEFHDRAKLRALALSPPSLTTISTFLSRLAACSSSIALAIAS